MVAACEPASPADRSDGLCATDHCTSPSERDSRRSSSKLLTGLDARRSCFQEASSRTVMRRSPGWRFPACATPELRQVKATPTASSPSGCSRDRLKKLDGGHPSRP